MDFEKFMQRRFKGLNFISYSTTSYLPGAILDDNQRDRYLGHLKSILFKDEGADKWNVDIIDANILHAETFYKTIGGKGSGKFLGFFGVKANVSKTVEMSFKIEDIKAAEFLNTSEFELTIALENLRDTDKNSWAKLRRHFIITHSFFAKKFTVEFKRNGKILTEAEFKNDIDISVDAKVKWEKSGKVIITNSKKIPFAVRGFVVRK